MTITAFLLLVPVAGGLIVAPPADAITGPQAARSRPAHPVTSMNQHPAATTTARQAEALRYWTPERMRHARPIEQAPDGTGTTHSIRPLSARSAAAPGHRVTPGHDSDGAHWTRGGTVATTTGRVFLTLGGREYFCSASTVASANHDVVVSTGHCLKDANGAWASKWTFIPGYHDGEHPYGAYTARRLMVATGWSHGAHDADDIGMAVLNTWHGRHVVDRVGGQRIAFGRPRGQYAYAFGYPVDPPYDGNGLVYCSGRLRADPKSPDQGLRCGMTEGASGGPWLTGFDPATGRGTITSVTSFKYSSRPQMVYGPYFGTQARNLYQRAQRA